MARHRTSAPTDPPPALGLATGLVGLVVLALGWLAFALAERGPDRFAGVLLLVVGLLAAGAGGAVLTRPAAARGLLLAAASTLAAGGVAAALLTGTGQRVFLADLLLLGGVPVLGGVALGLLAARRRAA